MSIDSIPRYFAAVDFDGTVVQDAFPEVGKTVEGAVSTLKWLIEQKADIIINTMRIEGTNLALPMRDLLDNNINVDGIIFLTDNEVNTGCHFASILNNYRKTINPDLRLVNLAMTGENSTIVDPRDSLSLGLSGLDSSCLDLALDFIEGKF